MKLSKQEQLTIANYNKFAQYYVTHNTPDFWLQEFNLFQNFLSKGRILEIGSGSGREAKLFQQFNYQYLGLDPSLELLKLARKHNPDLEFLQGHVLELKQKFAKNSFTMLLNRKEKEKKIQFLTKSEIHSLFFLLFNSRF